MENDQLKLNVSSTLRFCEGTLVSIHSTDSRLFGRNCSQKVSLVWPDNKDILKAGIYTCKSSEEIKWNGGVIPEDAYIRFNKDQILCFQRGEEVAIKINGKELPRGLWLFEKGRLKESIHNECD